MRCKFEIVYPEDHPDISKRGEVYRPPKGSMVVMNKAGVFFLFTNYGYDSAIRPLSEVLPKYDTLWVREFTHE